MYQYWPFLQRSWPLLAFGFLSIFWGNFGQSFFISWFGAEFQASLGLSATRYGLLYSLATLASGLSMLFLGTLIDRWTLPRFGWCAALGLLGAALVLSVAQVEGLLLLGLFLLRLCGQGLLPHMAQTTMARAFDQHRGKALSLSTSAVPVGEVLLPLLAVFLITTVGWQLSWLLIALSVALLYWPLSLYLLRRAGAQVPQPSPAVSGPERSGRAVLLSDYRFWLAVPGLYAAPFVITGVFIQQAFIIQQKSWTAEWLASCFVFYGLAHWCSALAVGLLIDRFSARSLLRVMLLPLIVSLACLSWLDGPWVAAVFMIFLGTTTGIVSPVTGALWAEMYGTSELGAIRSLVASFMIFSTALSPVIFGFFIDQGVGVQEIFSATLVAICIAQLLLALSYREP